MNANELVKMIRSHRETMHGRVSQDYQKGYVEGVKQVALLFDLIDKQALFVTDNNEIRVQFDFLIANIINKQIKGVSE